MKKQKRIIAGIILVLIATTIGIAARYIFDAVDYKSSLTKQPTSPADSQKVENQPQNDYKQDLAGSGNVIYLLFLGIDKTAERDEYLGIYRSDTIVIARLDLDSHTIKVLNIPRDTYTYIPIENKMDKINHAYAFGSVKNAGVQASIDAVHEFLGRDIIDYYFAMDMEPIPAIVDEIGGVLIDVEIPMKDHGADLDSGLQRLNGKQVFDYIHWRYSPGGDIDRIKRQQKFMSTLFKQQRDAGKLMETLQIVLKYKDRIQTDLSMQQFIGLIAYLKDVESSNVTYDLFQGKNMMLNGVYYWVPDEKDGVIQKFIGEE